MLPYKYITIEGNIGAGKTTLSTLLAEHLHADLILEKFEENPFLENFYADKDRYAFQVELFFLADRYKQLKQAITSFNLFSDIVVSDYFLDKCFIFARSNIKELEYKLYMQLFDIIKLSLPSPDLIVYLNTSTDKLLENIKKRGRSFEQNIGTDYLNQIHNSYIQHFEQLLDKRIVLLDVSDTDFIENSEAIVGLTDALNQDFSKGITKISL